MIPTWLAAEAWAPQGPEEGKDPALAAAAHYSAAQGVQLTQEHEQAHAGYRRRRQ